MYNNGAENKRFGLIELLRDDGARGVPSDGVSVFPAF